MFGETCVAYVTPKRLGPRSLWAKAAPLSVTVPTMVLNVHMVLGAWSVVLPIGLTAFRVL
jgi:hypothetical protein